MRTNLSRTQITLAFYTITLLLIKFLALWRTDYHWDAGYYLDIGLNFSENGQLAPSMWRLPTDAGILTGGGGGYGAIVLSWWFQVFGFTPLAGRGLMYLASLLALVALAYTAYQWWGADSAYWTVAVAASGVMFFHNYNLRLDALATLAYTLALALYVFAQQAKNRWLHFFVGIAAIATTEFHIIGLALAGGLALALGAQQIQVWREQRRLWASEGALEYMAGALLAGLVYIWVHILPSPEAYFLIPQLCGICTPAGPLKELQQFTAWALFAPVELMLFILAIYFIIRNQLPNRAPYLWILLGFLIGYAIVSPPVEFTYLGHRWFLMALGIGAFFRYATQKFRPMIYIAAILLIGFATARVVEVGLGDLRYRNYPLNSEVTHYITDNVPTHAPILAPPPYYRELLAYRDFATIHMDAIYTITLQDISHQDYLEQVQPDVIILEQTQLLSPQMLTATEAYIATHNMTEVVPTLWISDKFLQS